MGSAKFPSENQYDQYVNSHGGACNAFTEGEYTVYQFDITGEHLPKALDMVCVYMPAFLHSAHAHAWIERCICGHVRTARAITICITKRLHASCVVRTVPNPSPFRRLSSPLLTSPLDQFANCFISPLFKKNATERELKAIESEFSLARWVPLRLQVL